MDQEGRQNSSERPVSIRLQQWTDFAVRVAKHIEEYTVPQYGDAPDDQVEAWTADQCVNQIGKYVARFGRGQRGVEDELRDLMKVAHYACLAHGKRLAAALPVEGYEDDGYPD